MKRIALAQLMVCLAALTLIGASSAAVTPVASGLDSPRGLAFTPHGTLVVAEAGHGGDTCFDGTCIGTTGQISSVNLATGSHTAFATGLFSVLDPEGGAIGVDGLSFQGGRLLAIMGIFPQAFAGAGCNGQPSDCAQSLATARAQAGRLLMVSPSGNVRSIAGVGAYDFHFTADNPGGETYGTEVDANPYGVLALPGGTYVADAGSNTLDWVGNNGNISIVYRFPVPNPAEPFPTDAVPTCIAASSSGTLYVGDLAGRIWSVSGSSATLVSGQVGGRHFTGCAADPNGNVYFVSMFSGLFPNPGTGTVVKLAANGTMSNVAAHLIFPNGIAVGFGALYVSVNSVCPAVPGPACGPLTGGIVKITG
jgi:hypothetical protein